MPNLGRELEGAVRAWAVPVYQRYREEHASSERFRDPGPSDWALVFDCETSRDLSLRLRVGCYQVRKKGRLRSSGLFVDEDALSEADRAVIGGYAAERGLTVSSRAEFVEQVFMRYAVFRRAWVVGHNLAFDLSRLAVDHGPAKDKRGTMRGGFTLTLSANPKRPHVQLKKAGARSTLIRLTLREGRSAETRNRERGGDLDDHRGYFVDTGQAATALLSGAFSLQRLAEVLETEHRKLDTADHGAAITSEYLAYLERDVLVTWECFEKLQARYATYGLTQTPLYQVYSEASIGKALLREAGLTPWRKLQPDAPDWLIATIMESYYGGRSECMIRRSPRRGNYVDFTSEYPTVFVLQDLSPYLISTGIEWEDEDPRICQDLLDRLTVEDVLDPRTWPQLHALVLVEPDGARLPTRSRYRPKKDGTGSFNLGIADRRQGVPQWYTLADCCVSKLETGRAPRILRVLRFRPKPAQQAGLQPIDLAGDQRYRVDLSADDLIKRLVELRALVRSDQHDAAEAGDTAEAARLDAVQQQIKTTGNGIAYGIPIELNVIEQRRPVQVTVHLPDGTSYISRARRTEQPGGWFHPLIATLVASGGRLLLATLIALVRRKGGTYAFCDTDSLFIVGLTRQQVEEVVAAFESLNPYDMTLIPGSILKLEPENYDPQTGEPREIHCFAVAPKRYALFVLGPDGYPRLIGDAHKRRRSEHGLGHLLLPTDPDQATAPALDAWWEHLLRVELGLDHAEPEWFKDAAVGRQTVSSTHGERPFRVYNRGRPYPDRVRPWSFGLLAHLTQTERALRGATCLYAPYEGDPTKRLQLDWIDRQHPDKTHRITTQPYGDDDTVPVQKLGDYFTDYRLHTDPKMLGPDGDRCHPWTRGHLQPVSVTTTALTRISKETHPLIDPDDPAPEEPTIEYRPRVCAGCGKPLTGRQKKWHSDACRKRATRVQNS
jgi:hypothetical protein